jgi:hypothetical protein
VLGAAHDDEGRHGDREKKKHKDRSIHVVISFSRYR